MMFSGAVSEKSLPWIEGHDIPSMAWEFAQGVLTCETVMWWLK